MKTKILPSTTPRNNQLEIKLKSALGIGNRLLSTAACLGAVILICSTASAQSLFVSGNDFGPGEDLYYGAIFTFTWDGRQSIFASGLAFPGDLAFDSTGNLFVVECEGCYRRYSSGAIHKCGPFGCGTIFASGLSLPLYLAVDKEGNLFVADYENGNVYKYKPDGSRATFASGLYHPEGMAFDSAGNLFVADNSSGNVYQGSIYQCKPDASRSIFAVLEPGDRPADLAFDSMGNLFMADLGGNIYKYDVHGVLPQPARTTFGSVPNSAQSLAFDSAGNLFVVDAGAVIYKFTPQGVRSTFASGQALGQTFAYLAFQPNAPVCCTPTATPRPTPFPRTRPTPHARLTYR
jgi:sugar lactone lactonase YvrE